MEVVAGKMSEIVAWSLVVVVIPVYLRNVDVGRFPHVRKVVRPCVRQDLGPRTGHRTLATGTGKSVKDGRNNRTTTVVFGFQMLFGCLRQYCVFLA